MCVQGPFQSGGISVLPRDPTPNGARARQAPCCSWQPGWQSLGVSPRVGGCQCTTHPIIALFFFKTEKHNDLINGTQWFDKWLSDPFHVEWRPSLILPKQATNLLNCLCISEHFSTVSVKRSFVVCSCAPREHRTTKQYDWWLKGFSELIQKLRTFFLKSE